MNECANCGDQVTWNPRSSLCGECYENELSIKLSEENLYNTGGYQDAKYTNTKNRKMGN